MLRQQWTSRSIGLEKRQKPETSGDGGKHTEDTGQCLVYVGDQSTLKKRPPRMQRTAHSSLQPCGHNKTPSPLEKRKRILLI